VLAESPFEHDQDAYDLKALYRVLFTEVIPIFYQDRQRWLRMMRASIDMSVHQFSSHRMVQEYYHSLYQLPASHRDYGLPQQTGNREIPQHQWLNP